MDFTVKEFIVTIYVWDKERCSSVNFKFDNQLDAYRFATEVTDQYFGIDKIDVSIHWRIREK